MLTCCVIVYTFKLLETGQHSPTAGFGTRPTQHRIKGGGTMQILLDYSQY